MSRYFTVLGEKKAEIVTGTKFWQEQFVFGKGEGEGTLLLVSSTFQNMLNTYQLFPPPAPIVAAHIRNTNRHTRSRWLKSKK